MNNSHNDVKLHASGKVTVYSCQYDLKKNLVYFVRKSFIFLIEKKTKTKPKKEQTETTLSWRRRQANKTDTQAFRVEPGFGMHVRPEPLPITSHTQTPRASSGSKVPATRRGRAEALGADRAVSTPGGRAWEGAAGVSRAPGQQRSRGTPLS